MTNSDLFSASTCAIYLVLNQEKLGIAGILYNFQQENKGVKSKTILFNRQMESRFRRVWNK